MSLFDLLVVGRPPLTNAIEAESVRAVLQNTEALAAREDFVQANHALFISLYVFALFGLLAWLEPTVSISVGPWGHVGGVHVLA